MADLITNKDWTNCNKLTWLTVLLSTSFFIENVINLKAFRHY